MNRKATAHNVAHSLGLTRLAYATSRTQRVLSYHNVLPDGLTKNVAYDGLTVTVSAFRRHLAAASKRRRFSTVLGEPQTNIVTFDDGNLNNFECAKPVLDEFGAKAFFFIPLDTALNERVAWPDLISLWCEHSPPDLAPPVELEGAKINASPASRRAASKVLMSAAIDNHDTQRRICDHICSWFSSTERKPNEHTRLRFSAMSMRQINSLKAEGHFIGAHSVYHDCLSTLSSAQLHADMTSCAGAIGDLFNTAIYCYPFGGPGEVNSQTAEACRLAGFSAAFVNTPTRWSRDLGDFGLPRVTLLNQHSPAGVHCRISGLEDFIKQRIRRS